MTVEADTFISRAIWEGYSPLRRSSSAWCLRAIWWAHAPLVHLTSLGVEPPRFADIASGRYPQHSDAELIDSRPDRAEILPIPLQVRHRERRDVTATIPSLDVIPNGGEEALGSQIKHLRLRVRPTEATAAFPRTRPTLRLHEETMTGGGVPSHNVNAFLRRSETTLDAVTAPLKVTADCVDHVVLIQHSRLRDVMKLMTTCRGNSGKGYQTT